MSGAAAVRRGPLRVGMFGGGVVGGGVYELVRSRLPAGLVEIVKIAVRDPTKARTFDVDAARTAITSDPDDILLDDSLDCIVEVMGGVGLARTVVTTALSKGKAVVTANKALLAQELDSLQALSAAHKAPLCYEAAVCGGIPIIHVLQSCYAGDEIKSVSGICNGTTNYMLCQMELGANYGAALKEAQDLGYAEADPTADVEGHDVRAKIGLLAKLAFGTTVPQDAIPCRGISQITPSDFANADNLGATIKLLGVAQRDDGGVLSVYVSPHVVPKSHPLASASGSGNVVLVDSRNMGLGSYTGPGAGRYPTANSVVADLARLARSRATAGGDGGGGAGASWDPVPPPFPLEAASPAAASIEADYVPGGDWYVRLRTPAAPDGAAALAATAKQHGVRLREYCCRPSRGGGGDDDDDDAGLAFVVVAGPCPLSRVQAFGDAVGSPMCMPVAGGPVLAATATTTA